jgi:hypothetical protein
LCGGQVNAGVRNNNALNANVANTVDDIGNRVSDGVKVYTLGASQQAQCLVGS